jgi:hypothetical protein
MIITHLLLSEPKQLSTPAKCICIAFIGTIIETNPIAFAVRANPIAIVPAKRTAKKRIKPWRKSEIGRPK